MFRLLITELNVIQMDYIAKNLGNKFEEAAHCLGLSAADIEDLKQKYPSQINERNYQMLMKWKNSKGKYGTLKLLMRAFEEADFHCLVDDIPSLKLDELYTCNDEIGFSNEDQKILAKELGSDNYTRFLRLLGVKEGDILEIDMGNKTNYERCYAGIEKWKNIVRKPQRTRGRVISVLQYIERKDIIAKLKNEK